MVPLDSTESGIKAEYPVSVIQLSTNAVKTI